LLISLNEEAVPGRSRLLFKVIIIAAKNGGMPPTNRATKNKKKERKLITNAEVLEMLQRQAPAAVVRRNKKKGATHCEWIRDQVTDYLCSSSARSESASSDRAPDLGALMPELTPQEQLQITNLRPTELVELFLIVGNRFTLSQQEQLLALIQSTPCSSSSAEEGADPVVAKPDNTLLDVKMEPVDGETELETTNGMCDADPSPTSHVTPEPVLSVSPSEDEV
jgi:hypothetical protein